MKRTNTDEMVTLREAARRTGLGLRQIRGAAQRRELPAFAIGAWTRVRWHDVLAWIEAHRRL